ncbi:UL16-binding protein 1-like [Perognathus longimembris pacificus]|uniref:UL16-binding protein 1-like n=1 Tax=Perognathus longimembris pacificus TaxID=214514 RepID=UPI002019FBEA|nr:UL16-binding protein 1-like [Perognathus longimembris pacificus]
MARARISARGAWIPALIVLLLISGERADAHCLSYDIPIVWEQQYSTVIGRINEQIFVSCHSSWAHCKHEGPFGKKVIETKAWAKQYDTVIDIQDRLKPLLAYIKSESATTKDHHTLLVRMSCFHNGNAKIIGSWKFFYNGQMLLYFDSDSRTWAKVHAGPSWTEKILEDPSLYDFLYRTLVGDCQSWLEEFLGPWEEILQTTAPPIASKSSRITLSPYAILIVLVVPILFVNQAGCKYEILNQLSGLSSEQS